MTFWMGVAGIVLSATAALAEESPSPQSAPAAARNAPRVPLRVQVLVTRQQGDKKISSRPYHLFFYSGNASSVFVGNQVPLRFSDKGVQNILFKDVGTKLRCGADPADGNRYEVSLKYEDSFLSAAPVSKVQGGEDDLPVWRMLSGEIRAFMRDGETMQITSAVDPVTGDVVKAEMTLAVLK